MRAIPATITVVLPLLLLGCTPAPAAAPAEAGTAEARLVATLQGRFKTAEDKFVQLAEAVPEDQYDWRPMEGVRSFREVFIHVASDNWAPLWMGVDAPADIPVTREEGALRAYQEQRLGQAATVAELRKSFAFLRSALEQTSSRLGDRVTFGGREWGVDEMWVALATHMHEHLGQLIAYSRTEGIVPPWSK
ncbi:MAG: DinB family protein [Gemmatimonadales bacterium]